MATRELEKTEWRPFFDRVSRGLIGNRAEILIAAPNLGDQIEAEWLPLLGITYVQRTIFSRSLSRVSTT